MGTQVVMRLCNSLLPTEPSQQLQAYVAWVNAQLKKRPAVKPVQDLRQDLRDGVILAYLIEIVAGEKLSGVQLSPNNQQEMKNNVEKVLQFVASKKIRMHQTSAKDIVEGNLKSIMRLVLALAAHFKPGSSRTVNQGRNSRAPLQSHQPHCATAVAQGAAAALADVCHDMSQSGRDVFRYRQRNSSMDEEIENPYWSVRALVQQYEGQQRSPSESSCSSLTSPSPVHSAKSESIITQSEEKADFVIIPSEGIENRTEDTDSPLSRDWRPGSPGTYLETSWEEQLLEQQEHLEKEMEEAKKMISGLQALLLNGSLPEDEQERPLALCEPGVNPEEQLIIIQSRLDQSMEENQDLKKELLKCKQEARNLQGIKDALQQRLTQQDTSVLQLKQELLRANMDKDELYNQNVDLQRKLEERNRLLGEYKKELGQKDRLLQQHQAKLEEALRKLSEASYQQVDLERELEHKDVLLTHCMKREADEVTSYNSHSNGFLPPVVGKGAASITHRGTSDLQLVRDALRSLRNSFSGHDPQHHTIDSLEQGISSLMERLHVMETQKKQERRVRGKSPRTQAGSEYRESWPPNSKLPHSQSSPTVGGACTKVLYFTDRSLTPFMVNIPKRLGEVTLKDFKAAIDREGNHRYHFKALDPEFGTVKEEVFHDDDAIPGWEGKIVAWVEEDHGEN
ncbi:dixin isoform X6 [Rousettus aegyptiacus]|uniref:Dixin n=2 Tax=Rousettus aegyptiacus TaxID=9407 RepID=A0A7J8GXT4_ROUAE|nr:dixin isoform X6 [Rousettus aegyptiacus]XP_016004531.2 dixin isoform X6 [Rousettus aegyptiacus]KAF6464836.1 DIX domain containing 1 [Rousettus aegyptiacus]